MPDSPTRNIDQNAEDLPQGDYYYDDAFGYENYVESDDDDADGSEDAKDSREKTIANGDAKA